MQASTMPPAVLFLLALAPLVAFYVVESTWGLRAGIFLALAIACADVAYQRIRHGHVPRLSMGAAGLVLFLGGMSLWSNDERWFLWTPAIGDVVIAGVLGGSVLLGRSLLAVAAAELDPDHPLDEEETAFFAGVTLRLAVNFGLHAILVAWAATQPRETWLFVTGPIQYAMLGGQVAIEMWLAKRRPPDPNDQSRP